GRPQSRSPATAQREARGRSALLPTVSYTRCWDTIRVAGCSHRATWRIQNRRGSNRRWMKVQWQVTQAQDPQGPHTTSSSARHRLRSLNVSPSIRSMKMPGLNNDG
ncbi:hypothetical protein CO651_22565, partial [Rhizobium phaseoli]